MRCLLRVGRLPYVISPAYALIEHMFDPRQIVERPAYVRLARRSGSRFGAWSSGFAIVDVRMASGSAATERRPRGDPALTCLAAVVGGYVVPFDGGPVASSTAAFHRLHGS